MQRNSGRIGSLSVVGLLSASGVHDTFDNYNARRRNSWPTVIKVISATNTGVTLNENTSYTCTVTTEGQQATTTLYWTISYLASGSATDFNGATSGSFTLSNNSGSFTFITSFIGDPNKSTRQFQIQIRRDSVSGPIIFTSGTTTIQKPTLGNFAWSSSPIGEKTQSLNLNFFLSNCGSFSSAAFTISYSGTASSADFTSLPTSRNQSPGQSTNVSYTTVPDLTTEGSETLTASISYSGFASWGSSTLTITDDSVFPSISITPSTTNVTEGNSVTFTITDSTNSSGTLYWTVTTAGGASAADFTDSTLSGSFTLTNGSGSIIRTLVSGDGTETETFTLEVRYGSTSGSILQTSSTITITDAVGAPASPPASTTNTSTFTYTGSTQSFTVPAAVYWIRVTCNGAGGGTAVATTVSGGAGGQVVGWVPVNPSEVYTVIVGQGGFGRGASATARYGAGGGGFSGLINVSGNHVISAGGGGGGCSNAVVTTNGTSASISGGHTLVNNTTAAAGGVGGTGSPSASVTNTLLNGAPGTSTGGGSGGTTYVNSTTTLDGGGGGGGGGFGLNGGVGGFGSTGAAQGQTTQGQGGSGGYGGGGGGGGGGFGSSTQRTNPGSGGGGGYLGGGGGRNDTTYIARAGQGGWNFFFWTSNPRGGSAIFISSTAGGGAAGAPATAGANGSNGSVTIQW